MRISSIGFIVVFSLLLTLNSIAAENSSDRPQSTAAAQNCPEIPADARAKLQQEAKTLNEAIARCKSGAAGKACIERAKNKFSARANDVLKGAEAVLGGENRDCVGDTQGGTQANCGQGCEATKIKVPCTHCVGAYGRGRSGCFLWVCLCTEPAGPAGNL